MLAGRNFHNRSGGCKEDTKHFDLESKNEVLKLSSFRQVRIIRRSSNFREQRRSRFTYTCSDNGTAWNNRDPATLASLGVGLRWLVGEDLSLRLDYGIPLISVDNRGDSLQENGLYFSVRSQPF